MGCGGSRELKELKQEMKARMSQQSKDRQPLDSMVPRDEIKESKSPLASSPQRDGAAVNDNLFPELDLPGVVKDKEERSISNTSTEEPTDSARGQVSVSEEACTQSMPMNMWSSIGTDDSATQSVPVNAWCSENDSKLAQRRSCLAGNKVLRCGQKHARFSVDSETPQVSTVVKTSSACGSSQDSRRSIRKACTEAWSERAGKTSPDSPTTAEDNKARRSWRKASTEAWGGNKNRLWERRRSDSSGESDIPELSVEKVVFMSEPSCPKRRRRTQPFATWDAKDLLLVRKASREFGLSADE